MDTASPRALDEWTFVDDDAEVMTPAQVPAQDSTQPTPSEARRESESDENATVPEGFLQLRLRIGEQTRAAHFKATQVVQEFTDQFFAEEQANHKRIRLIYMGMLLLADRTMGEYGIEEGGVIHAVINDAPPAPHPEAAEEIQLKGLSNPINTLLLTTGVFLYGFWTLMYHYPHFFSWKSVFLLTVLTVIHISASVSRFSN